MFYFCIVLFYLRSGLETVSFPSCWCYLDTEGEICRSSIQFTAVHHRVHVQLLQVGHVLQVPGLLIPTTHTHVSVWERLSVFMQLLWLAGGSTIGSDLRGAFGGAVESGAAEEKVDLLPGFTTGFFHMKKTLNLWTRSRLQQVLQGMLL